MPFVAVAGAVAVGLMCCNGHLWDRSGTRWGEMWLWRLLAVVRVDHRPSCIAVLVHWSSSM